MRNFFNWLDEIAHINQDSGIAKWLERIAFIFLILMILSAPHSIAATQIAWLSGMLAWVVRLFIKPRPKLVRTPLDIALWIFVGWSVISSVFSYAPDISLDKLRAVGLFLIFYFIINNLRTKRAAVFLACALIFSCMASVIWTPVERIIGRGVQISGLKSESPLSKAVMLEDSAVEGFPIKGYLKDGDTILAANKKKVRSPEELIAEIENNETTKVRVNRLDYEYTLEVSRDELLAGNSATEKLGFESWKHSRSWRSTGFYGQFITFAEVLQMISSLTFGIFIVYLQGSNQENPKSKIQNLKSKIVLALCLAGMLFALLLTVTRASQAAFMVSAGVIVLIGASRKTLFTLAAIALPLVLVGLFFLQQSRNVGFFDNADNSTKWRETVYREGFNLWTKNTRNFTVGVGMDSIKRYAPEWHLFDDGKLPMGHFHSTPLQLAIERGLPALLLWLWILWIYGSTLWKGLKSQMSNSESKIENRKSKIQTGIILGCLGGLIGFFTSGLVHYNFGDGEVAMMFYILMGISVFLVLAESKDLKVLNGDFDQS